MQKNAKEMNQTNMNAQNKQGLKASSADQNLSKNKRRSKDANFGCKL